MMGLFLLGLRKGPKMMTTTVFGLDLTLLNSHFVTSLAIFKNLGILPENQNFWLLSKSKK